MPVERKHLVLSETRASGRSYRMIRCPFCETVVKAYLWSLAGSGKRCTDCGALHKFDGQTEKK